jgi:hypothetical protein
MPQVNMEANLAVVVVAETPTAAVDQAAEAAAEE